MLEEIDGTRESYIRMAVPHEEYFGRVLYNQPVAAHEESTIHRAIAPAVRASVVARAPAVVRIAARIVGSLFLERPRASANTLLLRVVGMTGMIAAVYHVREHSFSERPVLRRELAGNEQVDLIRCLRSSL